MLFEIFFVLSFYKQSPRLSVKSSALGPFTLQRVLLPPLGPRGGGDTLACGGGGLPILFKVRVDTQLHTIIPLRFRGSDPKIIFLDLRFIIPFKGICNKILPTLEIYFFPLPCSYFKSIVGRTIF